MNNRIIEPELIHDDNFSLSNPHSTGHANKSGKNRMGRGLPVSLFVSLLLLLIERKEYGTWTYYNEDGKWKVRASHWSPIQGGSGTSQTSTE